MSSATTLGGVKIGDNIAINTEGVISVATPYVLPTAATTQLGGVKIGNILTMDGSGFLNVSNPFSLYSYTTSTLKTILSTATGAMVFVSNAPGGGQPCYFDGGTNTWYTLNRTRVV
jgi:hypothetical protein